jgi:hypothetical protein
MQDPAWLIKQPEETTIWREVDGITVFGAYSVNEQNTLTVVSPYGKKATQLGALNAGALAGLLLRELYETTLPRLREGR